MNQDELQDHFLATDEMQAWDAFCTEARKTLDSGKGRAELPTAFRSLVLPELTTNPLQFSAFRRAWNRVCDEHGMQGEKKPEGAGKTPSDASTRHYSGPGSLRRGILTLNRMYSHSDPRKEGAEDDSQSADAAHSEHRSADSIACASRA